MRAIIRPHLSVGHFSRVQAVNRVGPWSPVISVEVVPSETGGDSGAREAPHRADLAAAPSRAADRGRCLGARYRSRYSDGKR